MLMAIVGAGRMGSVLANRFKNDHDLLIYDLDSSKAQKLAEETGGTVSSQDGLSQASLLILALPAKAVIKTVQNLNSFLGPAQVLVNIATTMPRNHVQKAVKDGLKVVSAKIIGHAKEIDAGEAPTVVVDGPEAESQQVALVFQKLGRVILGDEKIVEELNVLASTEAIRTVVRIRKAMQEQDLSEELFPVVIRNVCAGTMKAFAVGDVGPFVLDLARKLEEE